MIAAAKQIMTKNPDIAQRMMEHLKTQFRRPLQLEKFQIATKPVEHQPRAKGVQILGPTLISPSTRLSP